MKARISRATKETKIELGLDLDGGASRVDVPIPFLRHMLESFAKHSGAALTVAAKSLDGDEHHLAEDVALTLGRALREATQGKALRRFGHEVVPMDDALVGCYADLGGRGYYEGPLPDPLYDHFLRTFCHEAGLTCHTVVVRGRDAHHTVEAAFKALARSLRQSWGKADGVQSTKGEVELHGG